MKCRENACKLQKETFIQEYPRIKYAAKMEIPMCLTNTTTCAAPCPQSRREANRLAQQRYREKQKQTSLEIENYLDSLGRDLLRAEGGRDMLESDVKTLRSQVAGLEHIMTRFYEGLLRDDKEALKSLVRLGVEHSLELTQGSDSLLFGDLIPLAASNDESMLLPSLPSSPSDIDSDLNLEQMVPWESSPVSFWPASPPALECSDAPAPTTYEPLYPDLSWDSLTLQEGSIVSKNQFGDFNFTPDPFWMTDLGQGTAWSAQVF